MLSFPQNMLNHSYTHSRLNKKYIYINKLRNTFTLLEHLLLSRETPMSRTALLE